MIRIKWVDPKDRPDEPKGVEGLVEGRTIVLFKGRVGSLTEEHERAHIILGHHGCGRISPQKYVRDEIEAFLYTYRKLGKPRRLISDLRGIIVSLDEVWNIPFEEGINFVAGEFRRRRKVPLGWKRDLARIKEELS